MPHDTRRVPGRESAVLPNSQKERAVIGTYLGRKRFTVRPEFWAGVKSAHRLCLRTLDYNHYGGRSMK